MKLDLKRLLALALAVAISAALAKGGGDDGGGGHDGGDDGGSHGGDDGGRGGDDSVGSHSYGGSSEHDRINRTASRRVDRRGEPDFLRTHLPLEFAASLSSSGDGQQHTIIDADSQARLLGILRASNSAITSPSAVAQVTTSSGATRIEPKTITLNETKSSFEFHRLLNNTQDDVAVIIENSNYRESSIPTNLAATKDAQDFRQFATDALGISSRNIIHLKDATKAQLLKVFGSEQHSQGQLFDWIRPGKSRVYVYYAGHGAPSEAADSYLVPSDADSTYLELNGYPISTLYANLSSLSAKHVTVVLESCFSGVSQSGAIVTRASPLFLKPKHVIPPGNLTVVSAARQNQIASWEKSEPRSLFTKYFLQAMTGTADEAPTGNGDGYVSESELNRYLKDTVSYWAKRYYGRNQEVIIQNWSLR